MHSVSDIGQTALLARDPHALETRRDMAAAEDPQAFFEAVLDTINPLQHLPVVANVYRRLTGDEIAPVSRVVGGALFMGIGGFVSGLVNAAVETITGRDIGANAFAMMFGDPPASGPVPSMLAENAGKDSVPSAAASLGAIAPAAGAAPADPPAPASRPKPELATARSLPASAIATPIAAAHAAPTPPAAMRGTQPAASAPRFYAIDRRRDVTAATPTRAPQPGMIRPAEAGPSAAKAGQASGAYGRAIELSRQLQQHYQPPQPVAPRAAASEPLPGRLPDVLELE